MKLIDILSMLAAATLSATFGSPAAGQTASNPGPQFVPAMACAALATVDFSQIPEAPSQILRALHVEASDKAPSLCEVRGVVTPNVGFELKMPETTWNGRLFAPGCGNYCGLADAVACEEPLRRGYACLTTDSGHLARPEDTDRTDAQWAANNLAARLDYGGRATHVSTVAGKAVIRTFFEKAPLKSYFIGCSYGGHQAMVEAQRFPWDFDGIVGGGIPFSLSGLMQQNLWALSKAYDKRLHPVFSEAEVKLLHRYALARCDMDDGIEDGLISNPQSCKVDPGALVCKKGANTECLTQDKADIAKALYAGPMTSSGQHLTAGGWAPGTELFWRMVYRPDGTGLAALATNYFRYMGRFPDLGPGWSSSDYDFDEDYKRNDAMETLYADSNPDLRRFKQAGGKFIQYEGWSDMGMVPATAIDFYEMTERTMGGRAQTKDFYRMFMIPGALHCRGGEGADHVDYLSYIVDWVENAKAPDSMRGAHYDQSGTTTFTRPLYPYPQRSKYKGSGDPKDAANFTPVLP